MTDKDLLHWLCHFNLFPSFSQTASLLLALYTPPTLPKPLEELSVLSANSIHCLIVLVNRYVHVC